jgi:hypothetical protein
MDGPVLCKNCKYFHRNEVAEKYAQEYPELAVHGQCRRHAPVPGAVTGVNPVVRHPDVIIDTATGPAHAADLAREIVENYHAGARITLPNNRGQHGEYEWQIEFPGTQARSPNDWCGEHEWPGPSVITQQFADFLEESGQPWAEAAAEWLRKLRR